MNMSFQAKIQYSIIIHRQKNLKFKDYINMRKYSYNLACIFLYIFFALLSCLFDRFLGNLDTPISYDCGW